MEQDTEQMEAPERWSRRQFVGGMLAGGFALAVQPVGAQTIVTGAEGLRAGEVRIPTSEGEIPGYRAAPQGPGPFPTILVVQEIFGVHEHIRDLCRRLAHAGYLALAPELYFRQGDVSRLENRDDIFKVVTRVPDAQVLADLDAALAWAGGEGADSLRCGVMGFCWGGRITWLYAEHNPRLRAGVAWYGRLVGQPGALTPRHPVDLAGSLRVPVLGLYGGADPGIALDTVERMRGVLATGSSGSQIVVYPEAPHAFFADYRPSYRPEAARDGWARALAWLAANGVA